ncbi:hypothetical protein PoB_003022400 [Plakobranchus ocellatus]|uniref:Uncharacterized protein n=1 Tax=Plakobranchus ocellatus TaxID=259542 RepID=A0AAV4ABU0_9GAST|nr:hypothetical protein PoB_003022400 [Plakobranchus ocellatus]
MTNNDGEEVEKEKMFRYSKRRLHKSSLQPISSRQPHHFPSSTWPNILAKDLIHLVLAPTPHVMTKRGTPRAVSQY